jgi:hypothetical protein
LPVRSKVQVIRVGETTTTFVPTISAYPVRFSLTDAPDTKPVPARFVILTVVVFTPVFGVMDVTVGDTDPEITVMYPSLVVVSLPPVLVAVRRISYVPAGKDIDGF